MNNFNNPYVDPYSFQGNHFNDNRNATNSFHSHSSLIKPKGMEQKGTQQNEDHNQEHETKQQAIYTNRQIEKITGSKPIIFSPPKLDSSKKYMMNNEQQKQLTVDRDNTRDEDSEKKERVSSLMKEFSYVLDDDDLPILEESSNHQDDTSENESSSDEFSLEKEDKNDHENQFSSKQEESKNLFDELYSMLDESFDDSNENQEETEALSELDETKENSPLTMLLESHELEEEKQDTSSTNLIETKSVHNEDLSDSEKNDSKLNKDEHLLEKDEKKSSNAEFSSQEKLYSKFKGNSPSEDEFTLILEEEQLKNAENHEKDAQETASSVKIEDSFLPDQHTPTLELDSFEKKTESKSLNNTSLKKKKSKKNSKNKNQYEIALLHEDNNEKSFEKNSFLIDAKDKNQSTIVKLPVLLANLNIEIDILENIKFFMPLENISKVEWSMRSLHCKVALPSTTLFLKGELIAEIEFSNNGVNNTIHSLKVPIPWSKTTTVHWLTLPDLSHSYQNEFMFQSQHDPNGHFHYESYEKYAEAITSQLNQITFVSHHELDSKDQQLQIFGTAYLAINLMQEQFVVLKCYSN